ncbi:lipocalin family protein [Flavobacterium sp. SM15]|uniref:lipocalin family protein n=1 Tax=Flavobacterium sp. SM15 TaxID=2908005 RepID=UPI001EDB7EC8|nr:lipocalin family protein [Flavobacterium sp. SM15]MCG2611213.1 lipocalin family protein [Flavobacterium sp. SM15]
MRKYVILSLLMIFVFSCKPTVDSRSQVNLKGKWTVTNVSYPGSEYFKATSFQIAESKCFVGSTWQFVSNNNTGTMTLNQCTDFSSDIVWSITPEKEFTLKFIGEKAKARKVTQGFRLRIANQTGNSFQLIDKINVGGSVSDLVYQFEKVN